MSARSNPVSLFLSFLHIICAFLVPFAMDSTFLRFDVASARTAAPVATDAPEAGEATTEA